MSPLLPRFTRRQEPVRDLLPVFATSPARFRFYLERPGRGEALVGLGDAARVEAAGARRFADADRASRELLERLSVRGEPGPGPLLVGGFGFEDAPPATPRWQGFPALGLVLPRHLELRRGERAWSLRAEGAEPGAERPACGPVAPGSRTRADAPAFRARADAPLDAYRRRVEQALGSIHAGALEKVVVARSCTVRGAAPLDAVGLLATLRRIHPGCTLFAVALDDAVFLGATPERLVRRDGDQVRCAAVAGSAPRGGTPAEDQARARALLESKKDQEEHAIVVRALREGLGPFCHELRAPESPELLRTDGIQHLYTPVEGRLASPCPSVLRLAGAVHPTPAVGGTPSAAARAWLREHEGLDRGWYAGGIGTVDAAGDGAFAVALRSALLRGREASLFAGAGIVASSDPEAELAETRLKLRTILAPLMEI